MCPTNKTPSTDIIYPVPYWFHDCVTNNISIVIIALYMFNPVDSGYFSSWCKIFIDT